MVRTAMEVTCRTLLADPNTSLVVNNSKDAYPHDHGFAVNRSTPEAFNYHAGRWFH
jgi:hypothetical protein